MSRRYRFLIAIEKNELRFWDLALRVMHRARERSVDAGARVDDDLSKALAWAGDAVRARREEIAFLTLRARAEAPLPNATAASTPQRATVIPQSA